MTVKRVRNMTAQLNRTPHDAVLEAAKMEMIAFERKEREFRKRLNQDRADELFMYMSALKALHI